MDDKHIGIFFEKFSNTGTGAKTRRGEDIFPVSKSTDTGVAKRKEHPTLKLVTKRNNFITGTSISLDQKKIIKMPDRTLKRKSLVVNKVREVNVNLVRKNANKVQSNTQMKRIVLKKRNSTNRNANGVSSNNSLMNNSITIIDDEKTNKTANINKPRVCNKKICTESMPASLEPRSTRSVSRANKATGKKILTRVMTVSREDERAFREYYSNLRTSERERNLPNRNGLEKSKEKLLRENYARNVTSTVTSGALQTGTEPLGLQNNIYSSSSDWNSNASPYSDWNSDSDIHVIGENKPVLSSKSHKLLETTMQKKLYLGACPICFEELLETEIAATVCGHVFCMSCITQTVENLKYCPNCRKLLEHSDIIPLYL